MHLDIMRMRPPEIFSMVALFMKLLHRHNGGIQVLGTSTLVREGANMKGCNKGIVQGVPICGYSKSPGKGEI